MKNILKIKGKGIQNNLQNYSQLNTGPYTFTSSAFSIHKH